MLTTTRFATVSVLISVLGFSVAGAAQNDAQTHTERTTRFKQIDKNGDGKLSLVEFQTRPSNRTPEPQVTAAEMANRAERFKQLDKSGDGFLNFEEFQATETTPQPAAK